MPVSIGKKFEETVAKCLKAEEVCYDRLKDDMSGLKGSAGNVADFIVFRNPTLFYLECKSIRGNVFNYKNYLRDNQRFGLLAKSKYDNVIAGVLLWFIDHDCTVFIPIQHIEAMIQQGEKSFKFVDIPPCCTRFYGKKKRTYFNYEMKKSLAGVVKRSESYGY